MEDFKVQVYRDFFDKRNCVQTIKMAYLRLTKANVLGTTKQDYRKAQNMWFEDEIDFFRPLQETIANISGLPIENQESIHVVKYNVGGEYTHHHDYFYSKADYYEKEMLRGGQRLKTALIYLNEDFEGGETEFPQIGLKIRPETGKLIMWDNAASDEIVYSESVHSGLPVTKGVKFIMTIWIRSGKFKR